jgi:hypothetical protein
LQDIDTGFDDLQELEDFQVLCNFESHLFAVGMNYGNSHQRLADILIRQTSFSPA